MRIAVANWSSRCVGGIERYLDEIIPEFIREGHDLAFVCELDSPADRSRIHILDRCNFICVAQLGLHGALSRLREWRPEILFVQRLNNPEFEAGVLDLAPGIFFAHDYEGTCISGTKTFSFPHLRQCDRQFGAACLMLYFPRRCGGRSPVTMWKLYGVQKARLHSLRRYQLIVTASQHMRREYLKHAFLPDRVVASTYLVEPEEKGASDSETLEFVDTGRVIGEKPPARLLFIGRMERLKGGELLIDALPIVANWLERPVSLIFGGEGHARRAWELKAEKLMRRDSRVTVQFVGWLNAAGMVDLASRSDMLVVPSISPEPFGRVGPEAGLRGLPVAAFSVGGIPEWLSDGFNGYLAPGDLPSAAGLAEAITKCLRDPEHLEDLRKGSVKLAQRFNLKNHLRQLVAIFVSVLESGKKY